MTQGIWFWQALAALFLTVPTWIAIGFFERTLNVRPEIFSIWYFSGVALSALVFSYFWLGETTPSLRIAFGGLGIGLTIGAVSNLLLLQAISTAPNPGYAIAISNMSGVCVFLVLLALARLAPSYFQVAKPDPWLIFGVVLAVIGAIIVAIRH